MTIFGAGFAPSYQLTSGSTCLYRGLANEDLVAKYENQEVEKAHWLDNVVYVKRIMTVYMCCGKVDEKSRPGSIYLFFRRNGGDLKVDFDGQLSHLMK